MVPPVLSAVAEYYAEAFLILGFLVFRFRHGHVLLHGFNAFRIAWMGAHEIAYRTGFGILAETRPELDGGLWIVACPCHQNQTDQIRFGLVASAERQHNAELRSDTVSTCSEVTLEAKRYQNSAERL